MEFLETTTRDVMVMGRANVDMYVADPGDSLEESVMFEKSVGGSAANIAVGLARLDRRVDFLGLVSDDPFGRYVEAFLKSNGVGTRFLGRDDSGSLTSLAFAERRTEDSQVLFYRNRASDLMVSVDDIPVEEFRGTAALVVTGTGLSESPSREATLFAMEAAAKAGTKVIMDLDWRSSVWKSERSAGMIYRIAAERSDIIIGTRDEFEVLLNDAPDARGSDDRNLAERVLSGRPELVVIKRGPAGSSAYAPDGSVWRSGIYPVEVQKNYGAGDAFATGFIHGLMAGLEPDQAMRWGAGAAALVVSSRGCAASSPSMEQLERFISTVQEEL